MKSKKTRRGILFAAQQVDPQNDGKQRKGEKGK
jgi:hypothetical protein